MSADPAEPCACAISQLARPVVPFSLTATERSVGFSTVRLRLDGNSSIEVAFPPVRCFCVAGIGSIAGVRLSEV